MEGYFLIVSHLNACNAEGMSWVNEVLVTGLNNGDRSCNWRVEVHSSSTDEIDLIDDPNEDQNVQSTNTNGSGPAVYIIRKVTLQKGEEEAPSLENSSANKKSDEGVDGEDDDFNANVKIKFFGY